MFQKVGQGAHKLFTKLSQTPNLFRKIDNSIGKVSHYVEGGANALGYPGIANMSHQLANGVHQLRNNLEKSR
jgi:acetyl-CoA acetyltransferase